MGKIIMELKEGKIVKCTTEGMKAKPIGKIEKVRRVLTRNRSFKQAWKTFNSPIVYPNLNE